jgi:hypothetical protein
MLVSVWLGGTVALLLFRPGYTFPPFELLDSWIYTSYQWDLKNQIADFGPTYYGSRLSWILPGALIHSILSPAPAEICFKLLFSGLFAAACGTIVYRAAGIYAALVAVTLGVFAPQIIAALHADYVDTPVIVYAALTLACITVSRNSRFWAAWIFLGGIFFAGMLVANLSSIGTPGLGIAVFHLLWLRWGFRRQLASVGLYLLGILVFILAIGWIHVRAGGPFYFLKPQVGMVLYFHGLKSNPWTHTNWLWLYGATWLVIPLATVLWGARISLAKASRNDEIRRLIQALTAGLLVSLVWSVQLELKGLEVLSLYYYASYHLCFALPLLAVLCRPGTPITLRESVWTGLLVAALILFSFVGKPLFAWTSLVPLHRFMATPEFMPWLAMSVLLLIGFLASFRFLPVVVRRCCRPEFMVLGLIACSLFTGFHGHEISDRLQERYGLVSRAYRVVAREFPRGSYVYWIHPEERNGVSLASTKLWGYRMLTLKPFPELEAGVHVTQQTVIVPCPLGRGTESLGVATKALAAIGIELMRPRIIPVPGKAGLGFDLLSFSMQRVAIDPAAPPAGMKPPVLLMDFLSAGKRAYTHQLTRSVHDPAKGEVLDLSDGYPFFSPSDASDYLATQYQMCSLARAGQSRQLAIVTLMPAAGNCRCEIQDQQFRHILDVTLTKAGRTFHLADLPPDSASLRVVFKSPDGSTTPLPTHIQIYEIPE